MDTHSLSRNPHRRRMAQAADAGAISHHARAWHRARGLLRAQLGEAPGRVFLRGLRPAAVRSRRRSSRAAPAGRASTIPCRLGRDHGRPQLGHDPHRGALRALRIAPRPRFPRRPAADRAQILHQRRRDELHAGLRRGVRLTWRAAMAKMRCHSRERGNPEGHAAVRWPAPHPARSRVEGRRVERPRGVWIPAFAG